MASATFSFAGPVYAPRYVIAHAAPGLSARQVAAIRRARRRAVWTGVLAVQSVMAAGLVWLILAAPGFTEAPAPVRNGPVVAHRV